MRDELYVTAITTPLSTNSINLVYVLLRMRDQSARISSGSLYTAILIAIVLSDRGTWHPVNPAKHKCEIIDELR